MHHLRRLLYLAAFIILIFHPMMLAYSGDAPTCAPSPSVAPTPTVAAQLIEPVDSGFAYTESGRVVHQSRVPIILTTLPHASAWASEVREAAEEWNQILGFRAFIDIGIAPQEFVEPSEGLVPVLLNPEVENQAMTHFSASEADGHIAAAYIVMPIGSYSPRVAVLLVMHELGHVLGLGHDGMQWSLMAPQLLSINVRVTDADVTLLREAYGPPAGR